VRNFVELAEGGKQWTDPRTGRPTTDKLYDGSVFHRVIPDFMIQAGTRLARAGRSWLPVCRRDPPGPRVRPAVPAGDGERRARYQRLQFFITVAPTPWLTGKHTIFGEVIEGADVVDLISRVKTGSQDRPAEDVIIESITVERGPAA